MPDKEPESVTNEVIVEAMKLREVSQTMTKAIRTVLEMRDQQEYIYTPRIILEQSAEIMETQLEIIMRTVEGFVEEQDAIEELTRLFLEKHGL